METTIKRWYKKVWITRGSRFNAYIRLEKHANLSNLTISILTVYIIGLNLFPRISFFSKWINSDDIGNITIILSILILSISQYISSKEYRLKALKFHNCGKELSEIYDKLSLYIDKTDIATIDDIKKIITDYGSIITNCEENHSNIDRQIFICDNIKEFSSIKMPNLFIIKVKFLSFFRESFLYYFSIASPLVVLIFWLFSK